MIKSSGFKDAPVIENLKLKERKDSQKIILMVQAGDLGTSRREIRTDLNMISTHTLSEKPEKYRNLSEVLESKPLDQSEENMAEKRNRSLH